jgi:cytidylyltransferase family protein
VTNTVVDAALLRLVGGVLALLVVASAIGSLMHRRVGNGPNRATVENINARIRAWWVMASVFAISVLTGPIGSIALFALISFLAMREFVTLAPTRRADHRALLWCFFAVTPLEYGLIWIGWYGLFSILIPVYIFTFVAIRVVLAGDTERFLERTATMQKGNSRDRRAREDRDLDASREQSPEPIEKQEYRRRECNGADDGRDPHAGGHAAPALVAIDVELRRELGDEASVIVGNRLTLGRRERQDTGLLKGRELGIEPMDPIQTGLSVLPIHRRTHSTTESFARTRTTRSSGGLLTRRARRIVRI